MNAYPKNEQDNKVPYEPPALTVAGKVERLTAVLTRRNKDLLQRGNLL